MPKSTIRSVCVFCAARPGDDPAFAAAAADLGRRLAAADIRLVFGGGAGLMGVVADAVLSVGGEAVGIIPRFLVRREAARPGLTELRVVAGMHERKQAMFDESDAFVALPGGLGTFEETLEMITWRQLGRHQKPIVLVGAGGYWEPFRELVANAVARGFADAGDAGLFDIVETPEQALRTLAPAG